MKRKVLIVFVVAFCVKFFFSCQEDDCGCNDKTYDLVDMYVKAYEYQSAENIYIAINDNKPIEKENLVIDVSFDLDVIAHTKKNYHLGFSSAYACSCVYEIQNTISDIKVYMFNEFTEEKVIVTDNFYISSDISESQSITSFFADGFLDYELLERFELQLKDETNIGEKQQFEVEVTLKDGTVFTETTDYVSFIE